MFFHLQVREIYDISSILVYSEGPLSRQSLVDLGAGGGPYFGGSEMASAEAPRLGLEERKLNVLHSGKLR